MDANVTVRMDRSLYESLLEAAQSEKRRIGEMARIILEENVARYKDRIRQASDE